ncbi:MAG: zinc-ribbon domain-containing protein [Alphaproteobacteria bacterium]|nr:zinc-ribbon domain-containing protein [Alphaproteobacteria bacterium]
MLVDCPNCEARFSVADRLLEPAGRKLRCAACGAVWHQDLVKEAPPPPRPAAPKPTAPKPAQKKPAAPRAAPPPRPKPAAPVAAPLPLEAEPDPEIAEDAAEEAAEKAAMAMLGGNFSDEPDAQDMFAEAEPEAPSPGTFPDDDPLQSLDFGSPEPREDTGPNLDDRALDLDDILSGDAPEPIPEVFSGPPPRRSGGKKGRAKVWLFGFLGIVGIALGGAWYMRTEIANRWPVVATVLETLHIPLQPVGAGLKVTGLQPERMAQDGDEVLVVKGMITNTTGKILDVPTLRLSLYDAKGVLLQESLGSASKDSLASGENVGFRLLLKQPSQSAQRFEVGFFSAKGGEPKK